MTDKNYYEILEIPTDSLQEEINKAYIRAKNAYTQDNLAFYSLMSKDESDKVLELVEEGFSVLGDTNKRKQYDLARGISNSTQIQPVAGFESSEAPQNKPKNKINTPISLSSTASVKKLIAQKKFDLVFTVDDAMEKEIEATQNFTGEFLKKIREYKNVELQRMTEMTKVSKTYLIHIENENYQRLPALVYIRGFVYQYAKCLKLPPDLVATTYVKNIKIKTETN